MVLRQWKVWNERIYLRVAGLGLSYEMKNQETQMKAKSNTEELNMEELQKLMSILNNVNIQSGKNIIK